MINSRRTFIKSLAVGFIGGNVLSSIPATALAKSNEKGIEIQKGYIVLNEETQKSMVALAEALMPGSNEIGMRDKLMQYANRDRAGAAIIDAGIWNLDSLSRSKYEKRFYELKDEAKTNKLIKYIKVKNPTFFKQFKYLVVRLYYTDPVIWKKLSYNGPPQPKGFLDYSEPPKIEKE